MLRKSHQNTQILHKHVRIWITMSAKISTIVFKVYTPTKHKFKPLQSKISTPVTLDTSEDKEVCCEWSKIYSQNDFEWLPLSLSSLTKPVVAQICPKSLLPSTIEGYKIMNQEKYIPTTTN